MAEHPSEDFELTSFWVSLAGVLLVISVLILGGMTYAGRIDPRTGRNVFKQTATIADIERKYRMTFAPGRFLPDKKTHHEDKGSIVYKIVWGFLGAWFFMSGVFLVLAGALRSIEVYRVDTLFNSIVYVSIAFVLCGFWSVVFREGSKSEKEEAKDDVIVEKLREDTQNDEALKMKKPNAPVLHNGHTKSFYLAIANIILFIVAVLALAATSGLQAWTLPSGQYGMLLFFGPGLGLLSGWLLYALLINYAIVISADSNPDGLRNPPDGATKHNYPASMMFPIVGAGLLFLLAIAIPDPALPLPFTLVVLGFTPKHRNNLIAVCIGVLGIAVGGFRVYTLRS